MGLSGGVSFNTGAIGAATDRAALAAMEAAAKVMLEAIEPLTPEDTGALIGSARIEVRGKDVYLIWDSEYAEPQHEHLDWQHSKGGPKFAERGIRASVGQARAKAQDVFNRELG